MSKPIESGLRASYLKVPVGKALAGLGAALVLAAPSAALAQSRACSVQFSVSNATQLGSLQFNVDYAGAGAVGDFATGGCALVPGSSDAHVNVAADTMGVGWANVTPFDGPGLFATCNFVLPDSASTDPAAGDFAVTVVAASDAQVPPVDASPWPTIAVAMGACTNVAPECRNGVLESGEKCDDGNDTAGDGCDAACGLSSCETTPVDACRVSTAVGKSKLLFKNNADDTKDQGQYQWKSGQATTVGDFHNPVAAGATYSWCVYDQEMLVGGASVAGGASTWKAAGTKGFGFKGDVQGLSVITLKSGAEGKASISVKAKSKAGNYRSPALPLVGPTLSQFVIDDGVSPLCFQTTAGTPVKNVSTLYGAKGNP